MSVVTTFQTLQTTNLITLNHTVLSQNFRILDQFLKQFPSFQRKLVQIQKTQKSTFQDLANFKLSTQNTFATLNDIVETRGNGSKGMGYSEIEEVQTLKKELKEIKSFISENSKQQQEAQQARDRNIDSMRMGLQNKVEDLKSELEQKQLRISNLEEEIRVFKVKFTSKAQLETNNARIGQTLKEIKKSIDKIESIEEMLLGMDVKNMRESIDLFQTSMTSDFEEIKRKLKLKADYSDLMKLQDMLLNIINYAFETSHKKFSDKVETKKAFVYLEKKINRLLESLFPDDEVDREGIVTTKGLKCISCTKDLGDMEGKLDKFKAWSVFPTKDPHIKDRYSGFGAGFQTIVETTLTKKGSEATFDEKGRMTAPYNLTREVQGNLLRPTASQSKITRQSSHSKATSKPSSPIKSHHETNFMMTFGRNNDPDINIKDYYMEQERGLMAHIKYIIDGNSVK